MRRPSPYTDRRGELDIKMTPMIDVVFLLLVFFVWTASFQIVERVLPSNLAAVVGTLPANADEIPPPEEDFDKIVVRVRWLDGQPAWTINDTQVVSLPQIRSRLEAIADIKRDAPVILHPDQDVPLGHVIDLYDITRLVGFDRIQFTASERI
jgi:biopolymer transport protein ExbD